MKVISGGQTGADQAGLFVAKKIGLETGGWAPKNWMTSNGPQKNILEGYNLIESEKGYKGRTWENIRDSNATIRLAVDFNSPGEICTLEGINYYKKPWLDIDLLDPKPLQEALEFLILVKPRILNIAGNTEGTRGYRIFESVNDYLMPLLFEYKRRFIKEKV